jgi:hypothetical protein
MSRFSLFLASIYTITSIFIGVPSTKAFGAVTMNMKYDEATKQWVLDRVLDNSDPIADTPFGESAIPTAEELRNNSGKKNNIYSTAFHNTNNAFFGEYIFFSQIMLLNAYLGAKYFPGSNPMAVSETWESQLSGPGLFGFYMFSLAMGLSGAGITSYLLKKGKAHTLWGGAIVSSVSLAMGAIASQISSEFLMEVISDPRLIACRQSKNSASSAEEDLLSSLEGGNSSSISNACLEAQNAYSLSSMKSRFGPEVATNVLTALSIIPLTIAGGMVTQYIGATALGKNIKNLKMNSFSFVKDKTCRFAGGLCHGIQVLYESNGKKGKIFRKLTEMGSHLTSSKSIHLELFLQLMNHFARPVINKVRLDYTLPQALDDLEKQLFSQMSETFWDDLNSECTETEVSDKICMAQITKTLNQYYSEVSTVKGLLMNQSLTAYSGWISKINQTFERSNATKEFYFETIRQLKKTLDATSETKKSALDIEPSMNGILPETEPNNEANSTEKSTEKQKESKEVLLSNLYEMFKDPTSVYDGQAYKVYTVFKLAEVNLENYSLSDDEKEVFNMLLNWVNYIFTGKTFSRDFESSKTDQLYSDIRAEIMYLFKNSKMEPMKIKLTGFLNVFAEFYKEQKNQNFALSWYEQLKEKYFKMTEDKSSFQELIKSLYLNLGAPFKAHTTAEAYLSRYEVFHPKGIVAAQIEHPEKVGEIETPRMVDYLATSMVCGPSTQTSPFIESHLGTEDEYFSPKITRDDLDPKMCSSYQTPAVLMNWMRQNFQAGLTDFTTHHKEEYEQNCKNISSQAISNQMKNSMTLLPGFDTWWESSNNHIIRKLWGQYAESYKLNIEGIKETYLSTDTKNSPNALLTSHILFLTDFISALSKYSIAKMGGQNLSPSTSNKPSDKKYINNFLFDSTAELLLSEKVKLQLEVFNFNFNTLKESIDKLLKLSLEFEAFTKDGKFNVESNCDRIELLDTIDIAAKKIQSALKNLEDAVIGEATVNNLNSSTEGSEVVKPALPRHFNHLVSTVIFQMKSIVSFYSSFSGFLQPFVLEQFEKNKNQPGSN